MPIIAFTQTLNNAKIYESRMEKFPGSTKFDLWRATSCLWRLWGFWNTVSISGWMIGVYLLLRCILVQKFCPKSGGFLQATCKTGCLAHSLTILFYLRFQPWHYRETIALTWFYSTLVSCVGKFNLCNKFHKSLFINFLAKGNILL